MEGEESLIGFPSPWVDGVFRIQKSRWGTWSSYDKMENRILVSYSEAECISSTRHYLKYVQEKRFSK